MARLPRVTDYSEFIGCRSLAHKWNHVGFRLYRGKRTPSYPQRHEELVREIVCERCGSGRMDRFLVKVVGGRRRVTDKIGSHRTYPDGYIVPGGGLARADFVQYMAQQGLSEASVVDISA